MSESKSKIVSFRLSAEIEMLAQKAAIADGEKNASAWCQKLVINALSKKNEPTQNDSFEYTPQSMTTENLIKFFVNLRQWNFECFELLFKGGPSHSEFIQIAIQNECEWEKFTENTINSVAVESSPNNLAENTNNKLNESEPLIIEEITVNKFNSEKVTDEFLIFAEELENEVAELISSETVLETNHTVQTDNLLESPIPQIPARLPFFDIQEQ